MTLQSPTLPGVLSGLLRDRGTGLLDDRRRLLGLLRDKLPSEVRAIRILMMAFDQGVAARLRGAAVSGVEVGRESSLLAAETGLSPDVARQAVETWAVALGHDVPATAPSHQDVRPGGTRPSVERLPPRPAVAALGAPMGTAGAAGSAAAASPNATAEKRPWARRWPALVIGLVILLGGVARLVKIVEDVPPAQPSMPEQPPATSPQTQPAAPKGAPAAKTPEGIAAVSREQPYPTFATERIKDSQTTLGLSFGVPVGQDFVSYYAAFAFDKGQQHGKGIITVLRNRQKATTNVIDAERVVETDTGKHYLRVFGPLAANATGAPDLCVFAEVTGKLDRLDVIPQGLFAVFGLDQGGHCDTDTPYGFGRLK